MDILLDVNIVLDICTQRKPHAERSALALELAKYAGGAVWLYCGSTQTLEYNLYNELKRGNATSEAPLANKVLLHKARKLLDAFAKDKNWLAALAGEGDVFTSPDPEDEQLIRALERFAPKSIKLLTRDAELLGRHPDKTITPDHFIRETLDATPQNAIAFIDLPAQQSRIRSAVEKNIHQVLHHGKYIMGPEIGQLESRLADYVGARHCITCSSGTDALLMALMALDIGPGDAVFTSPFTFIATAEVIALLGATPVFVDIDSRAFNIDPDQLEKAIQAVEQNDNALYPLPQFEIPQSLNSQSLNPKAIIPVDLFGLPADYDRINSIAEKYGLWVIEDAAQSLGAKYKAHQAGSLAHIGCTSFFPAKPLGGYGDGGAIFTDDDDLAHELKSIRVYGKGTHKYDNARVGINGRLDTMQAAVLLAKLDIFPDEIEKRQSVAQIYSTKLTDAENLSLPQVPEDRKSAWAQYSILARDSDERQKIQEGLKAKNIPSVIYYPQSLHQQGAFKDLGYAAEDMPTSRDCASRIFSLPMHPYLTDTENENICASIKYGK